MMTLSISLFIAFVVGYVIGGCRHKKDEDGRLNIIRARLDRVDGAYQNIKSVCNGSDVALVRIIDEHRSVVKSLFQWAPDLIEAHPDLITRLYSVDRRLSQIANHIDRQRPALSVHDVYDPLAELMRSDNRVNPTSLH
ncbi:hypothetical protein [Cedecea sp.]|jgi:hypothetical protein|uniref:hypothetical protein n=1 Tax=Cedecea sp. TaxID=1970739 RepID=UPI002F42B57B